MARELNTAILFLHLENFATFRYRCVQTACRMDLFTKAKDLGIQTEFIDGQGHRHVTDAAALKIILDALPVRSPHRFLEAAGRDPVRAGPRRPGSAQAATFPLRWKIVAVLRLSRRARPATGVIAWPADLPEGAYRLHLTDAASFTEEAPLIVAPPRAFGGDFDRCWLLAVQLYGVRSARNWGIGDFTDLEALIELAAISAPTGSASIRCMRCSTTGRAIAAPIRRTAGCFSMRSISMSKNFPEFQPGVLASQQRRSPG